MQDLGVPSVSIDTYVCMKIFELFRDRLTPIVNKYRKDEKDTDLYRHLFLAPESYSRKRVFQVRGVLSPYCCLWATSPLKFNKQFYPRSVLPIDFSYVDAGGEEAVDRGFLYDYEKTFEFSSGSFFKDFVGQVNQDILDFDRLRYFKINVGELLKGYDCVIELMLNDVVTSETVDQASGNRSFILGGKYSLKITLPILSKPKSLDSVSVFLNSHQIYQREAVDVSVNIQQPSPPLNAGVVWEDGENTA